MLASIASVSNARSVASRENNWAMIALRRSHRSSSCAQPRSSGVTVPGWLRSRSPSGRDASSSTWSHQAPVVIRWRSSASIAGSAWEAHAR